MPAPWVLGTRTIAGRSFRLYELADPNHLVDRWTSNEFGADERMPYWANLWPSAVALAEHVLTAAEPPAGPAIELGAGLGLASLALAARGVDVLATDYMPDALERIAASAAASRLPVATRGLDFARCSEWSEGRGHFRTVVAADVLYEARLVESLADAVAWLLAADGKALIADPLRAGIGDFERALGARGLTVEPIVRGEILVVAIGR